MRNGVLKALAAICASAPLLVLLLLSIVMMGTDASVPRKDRAPDGENGATTVADSVLSGAVTRWLEQAASTYQSDIARKLSVPRQAGMVAGVSSPSADFDDLRAAIEGALRYITFWMEQAYRTAGYAPSNLAYSSVALLADQTARDARAFVEARRKAEADWNEAVERANRAAAEAANQDAARKSAAEKDAAEADRRRAEARKEELRKLKEDLDRRIEEGLKRLEELEKLDPTKKTEATRKALVADVARGAAENLKAVAEARRAKAAQKAAAEKQAAEAKAAYAREVAAAEQARKTAEAEEAEQARRAAADADRKRLDAEQARKAEAERKALAEARAAEEVRMAEAQADYARRVAAAEADRKRLDRKQTLRAEEAAESRRMAEVTAGDAQTSATETAAREAEQRQAEIRAIEERRQAAAEAEALRKADEARRVADAKRVEAHTSLDEMTTTEKSAKVVQDQEQEPRLATTEPAAVPSEVVVPRRKQLHAARASAKAKAKARVVKSRRHAAKARHKRKKMVRTRPARIHVVRRGETLWSISCRHLGDGRRYRTIYRANRGKIRNPHRIWPGQRLRLW
jgi:nucleoid-associated protein YgaU